MPRLTTSQRIGNLCRLRARAEYACGPRVAQRGARKQSCHRRQRAARSRRLIAALLVVTAAGLGLAAAAPTFVLFAIALAVVDVSAVVAQIVVPMSSSLAGEHERGSVVGTVMSGLLIGILLARTISGIVAQLFGWRVVFAFAGVAMLLLAAILSRALPKVPATERLRYPALLRSVLELVKSEPLLRQRMVLGATAFGCFSVLWTSLAFLALDLGAHAMHISNQSAVYTLHGQARSRLTTAYMGAYVLGGVVLSATTSALYASGGWYAVCVLGAATAAVGLVTWLASERAMSGRLPIGADSAA
ncbi:MAG: MFS transporter [Solirubrobacteraceae bacterium]